jgi:hypothetical protein
MREQKNHSIHHSVVSISNLKDCADIVLKKTSIFLRIAFKY